MSDEEPHSPFIKKLKSPWIPNIISDFKLRWHILDHHTRSKPNENGVNWRKSSDIPTGMTPAEYHQLLHAKGEFEWGQEHQHFEPKKR